MKSWSTPKMSIFSVKLGENIASSGESAVYKSGVFWFTGEGGGNLRNETLWYVINSRGTYVQDTVYAGGSNNIHIKEYDKVVTNCRV